METADPFQAVTGSARHAAFGELAAAGPVQRKTLFTGVTVWLVTGYDEVRELLSHPAVVKQSLSGPHADQVPPELSAAQEQHLLTLNPPDHTRLRRLVTSAFTRRRVELLAPRVQQLTDGLLDRLAALGRDGRPVDFVGEFAYPLPIAVICELLGIPDESRAEFGQWSRIVFNGSIYPAGVYVDAVRSLVDFVRHTIGEKRATPADDLLSDLIEVRDGDDRLSENELTSMVNLMLVAGFETTAALLSLGLHALLTHPGQLRLLRAEPDRLPAAVEEMLRYDGPTQVSIPAVTAGPVEIAGTLIPEGAVVLAVLNAADRDPEVFPDPERFDISRAPAAPSLAFGHGIHRCLGAPLARLEAQIAFGSILRRFPHLHLAGDALDTSRRPGLLINAVDELAVVIPGT